MTPFALQSSQETDRFSEILNPIRDLAKNWDVDIAFHLEEYLSELKMIAITFDGGQTTMNFAQAALLIQGSTCVYSRKVDFLYNLVMQLLDILHTKKAQQTAAQHVGILHQSTTDSEQFLELKDSHFLKITDSKDVDAITSNASLLLPKVPFGVYSQTTDDKRNVVLYSRDNEILGKKNDFFLNFMEVFHSGAAVRESLEMFGNDGSVLNPRQAIADSSVNEKPPSIQDVEDNFDFADDNDFPPEIETSMKDVPKPEILLNTHNHQKKMSPPRTSIEKALQTLKRIDSHEDIESKRKPLIIAPRRTLRVLKQLENMQALQSSRLRRKKVVVSEKHKALFASKFCDEAIFSRSSKFPKNAIKLPTCPSFYDQFYEEFKRRKIILHSIRSQLKNKSNSEETEKDIKSDDEENLDFGVDVNVDDDIDEVEKEWLFPTSLCNNTEINKVGNMNDLNSTSTFEEIIRKHTEAFITATHEHARMSAISRKVKLWDNALSPLLEKEESRPIYDMQNYSKRVLKKFAHNSRKQTLSFPKIVSGEPNYEVARLFLAALQLANNYKIDINLEEGDNLKMINQMDITLLSNNRCSGELSS